ncbi:class I SAM-dependent methyltransferase [Parasphingorhabdus sp.]|uniref:class I SAM-dependent methyltransferase n=1 Tax=Parasphingorhabdus sp. TaxID=2709688 RepID=UPI003A9040B5
MNPSPAADAQEIARKLEEKEFHDSRERDRKIMSEDEFWKKYSNKKWYTVSAKIKEDFLNIISKAPKGSTFLDLGCGLGEQSLTAAKAGLKVHSIDISPESVEETRDLLTRNGFTDFEAQVMDAEHLTFEDNKFDLIVCSGVLHHMDVVSVFPELARVLKPSGKIIALEALGYNPFIQAYRRLTPKLRTAWEADHIITFKELRIAKESFEKIQTKNYFLLSILAAWFHKRSFFKPMLKTLLAIDDVILRIPGFKHMSWQIMITMSGPKK